MTQYYLWNGLGAIEDLEDVNEQEARKFLEKQKFGNWTLWKREDTTVKLLGVNLDGCEIMQFNVD